MPETEKIPVVIRQVVDVTDPEYFCNKSWTLSYNVNTKSWVSFHSYIPNFYIAENNFFYSGLNSCCDNDVSLDVFSTIVLPPELTTTTTSTSRYTTTSSTTKSPLDCGFEGSVVVLDCSLQGSAINKSKLCSCYTIRNTSLTEAGTYSYTTCDDVNMINVNINPGDVVGICAKTGSVVVVDANVSASDPLGACTEAFECEITTTTTTSTTQCPNCKTYTLENTTSSSKTATNIIDCETGLLLSATIPANLTLHVCSCNPPTVPTGLTSTEFGIGCTKCFCHTVTNIEGVVNYFDYMNCDGVYLQNQPVPAYSSIYICAIEGTILPLSPAVSYTGGSVSCTDNVDCDCWDC